MTTETFASFEHNFWQRASAPYDAGFGALTAQIVPFLQDAAAVKSGTNLLDIACGPGYGATEALKRGAHITGLDFSTTMIALAQQRFPAATFQTGDAQNLLFENESFEAVTCGFGLMHFPDPDQAIAEAARVLKPSGRYAFAVWGAPTPHSVMGIVIDAIKDCGNFDIPLPQGQPFFKYSDPAIAKSALETHGFKNVTVHTLALSWPLSGAAALITAFREGGARIGGILRAQTPEALAKIETRITEKLGTTQKNGNFNAPAPVVMACGTRELASRTKNSYL